MRKFEKVCQGNSSGRHGGDVWKREAGCKIEDVSDVGLRMRALAGELYRLEASMEWLERQALSPNGNEGKQLGPAWGPAGRPSKAGGEGRWGGVLFPVPSPLL